MTSKYRTEGLELGLLSDCWQYVRQAERSTDVRISCEMIATNQRGVWNLVWTARAEHQNGGWVPVCSHTAPYPTAHHSTLAGALLRGSMEIERLVEEWTLGVYKHLEAEPVAGG